ncbi:MAG: hypothetical protein HUK14_05990 [Muribaculaceae bacterium]|nr:hypothetical protein [Muribaculaceae bacterium]
MLISPFTPLFFKTHKSDGIESRYIQTFAPTDHILVEIFVDLSASFSLLVSDEDTKITYELPYNSYKINDTTKLLFAVISGLSPGYYRLYVAGKTSNIFRITDDKDELATTTLIQYSMKDNKQRTDALFIIDGMRYFFDFRVPGGFKDSGWTFAVDNEQFVTPDADPVELFALESTQKKFTMGYQEGVPVHFAELLNRLLTCTYVYFDGVRYARKDSSVPEMNVPIEGLDSFVFTQLLQRVNNLNPSIETSNHLIMRRTETNFYRTTVTNSDINRITE